MSRTAASLSIIAVAVVCIFLVHWVGKPKGTASAEAAPKVEVTPKVEAVPDKMVPAYYGLNIRHLGRNAVVVSVDGFIVTDEKNVIIENKCNLDEKGPRAQLAEYFDEKKDVISASTFDRSNDGHPLSLLVFFKEQRAEQSP